MNESDPDYEAKKAKAHGTDNETVKEYNKLKAMSKEEFIAYVKGRGSPTHDALSAAVWHGLSGSGRDSLYKADEASEIYKACGYKPFSGWPLEKVG